MRQCSTVGTYSMYCTTFFSFWNRQNGSPRSPRRCSLLMPAAQLLKHVPFVAPSWASHLKPPTHGRIILGHLPTPIMPWACPALRDLGVRWSIKRDDLAGAELSGNKVCLRPAPASHLSFAISNRPSPIDHPQPIAASQSPPINHR